MTHTGRLSLKDSLEVLVIDEADQVLLHGYGDDVKEIVVSLPPICQVSLSLARTEPCFRDARDVVASVYMCCRHVTPLSHSLPPLVPRPFSCLPP